MQWYNLSQVLENPVTMLWMSHFLRRLRKGHFIGSTIPQSQILKEVLILMELCNIKRPHRTLKKRTPCQMEEEHQKAT